MPGLPIGYEHQHGAIVRDGLRRLSVFLRSCRSTVGTDPTGDGRFSDQIGTDMSVFPSAGHCASWAGQCSGDDQSAGKRRSRPQMAQRSAQRRRHAAIRTNDSYLQAQYRRLKPRIGHGRALGAVKHSILCAIWHMLTTGELYRDLGGDYFRKRDPERQTKRLVAQLERPGHKVTLEALPEAA